MLFKDLKPGDWFYDFSYNIFIKLQNPSISSNCISLTGTLHYHREYNAVDLIDRSRVIQFCKDVIVPK